MHIYRIPVHIFDIMTDITATLDAVEPEDQTLVKELLAVLQTLKLCTTWTVNVVPKGYEILAWIGNQEDLTVSLDDLDLIQQVNRLRVPMIGVKLYSNIGKSCIRIFLISHKEPVMVHEQTVLRLRKRKSWL